MADYIQQIAPNIYYSRWQPQMEIKQIADDVEYISQAADELGVATYATILDMTDCVNFSMDVSQLTRIARSDARVVGYIIIKGDRTAKFLGGLLNKLSKHDFAFVETYDEAVTHAQNLLQTVQA